jgi:hypothetical protein
MPKKKATARKAALKSKSKNARVKKSAAKKKAAPRSASSDQALRHQLVALLKGDQAHADFDSSIGDWPIQLAGVKVANFPHTAWMLLEHMRLAQWDLLEFSRNPKYVARKWPEEYWPTSEAPPSEKAWTASIAAFKKDLKTVEDLVTNSKTELANSLGRRADHLARDPSRRRPQLVSLRPTGHAAQEHRNLMVHRRDAECAEKIFFWILER